MKLVRWTALVALFAVSFVSSVPTGASLPAPGQGVLIGIVDTGIDWTHPDFRVDRDGDGTEEGSRVRFVWDQVITPNEFFGDPPAGFDYGVEYARERLEEGLTRDPGYRRTFFHRDAVGHGTWVAGIAGGDGSSSELDMRGVAPHAQFAVVRFAGDANPFRLSQHLLDAVRYLIARAEALERRLVINMSIGLPFFPRNGRDPVAQEINALIERHGVPVVVAAGNENAGRAFTHVRQDVPAGQTVEVQLQVPRQTGIVVTEWWPRQPAGQLALRAFGPGGELLGEAGPEDANRTRQAALAGLGNDATSFADPKLGTAVFFQRFSRTGAPLPHGRWTFSLTNQGDAPIAVDGWVRSAGESLATFPRGDDRLMIQTPGTADGVITVGAYNVRNRWTNVNGETVQARGFALDVLSSFSSCGPSQDGRVKPEVLAPGAWVPGALAANSSFSRNEALVLEGGRHFIGTGTSAASPMVAGTVALMMQAAPELSPVQIKKILVETTRTDAAIAGQSQACVGFGKLAQDAAVREAVRLGTAPDPEFVPEGVP